MKRIVTALLVAAETFAIATGTLALIALPVLLVWTLSFGLSGDPLAVFSLIGNLWFFGNGVPLSISLTAAAAAALGLPPSAISATFSLIPLGFVVLTAFWASRVGKRLAALDWASAVSGAASGTITLVLLAWALRASIPQPTMLYTVGGSVAMPVLIFIGGMLSGYLIQSARDDAAWLEWLRAQARVRVREHWEWLGHAAVLGIQAALVTLVGLIAVSALVFGLRLMTQYVEVITLSQQLQLDALGVVVMFIATLSYLPTLLIWTLSWMIGPGFAIGAGSSVSAVSTQLGPIPSVPVFGILPAGSNPWGLAFVSLILLAAIAGSATALRRSQAVRDEPPKFKTLAIMALVSAVSILLMLAVLFWAASGSMGPGRLETVGPEPWLVAAIAAAEVLFGVAVGAWLTLLDWNRILEESRSRSAALTNSRLGVQVQKVTSRLRRRPETPIATDDAGSQHTSDTAPSATEANDTVELSDFRPWWNDGDDKL